MLFYFQNAAINLRQNVARAISQIDEKLSLDDLSEMDEGEKVNVLTLFRETLHQCYNFGFEVCDDCLSVNFRIIL